MIALVLAGTRAGGDPLAEYAGVTHKALIEIGGCTMIERVVRALAAVGEVSRIVIAIDRPEVLSSLDGLRPPACRKSVVTIPAAEGPSASVASVLASEGTPLLVTTADHALLRPELLRSFLDASPADVDAVVALARRENILAAVPDAQRTYLRFVDGEFSGCNLFLLRRPAAAGVVDLWRHFEVDRKRPLRLMLRAGTRVALRYGFGRLGLHDALAHLERLSGARVGIVELSDGRAAVDVDKPADLDQVRRLVAAAAD